MSPACRKIADVSTRTVPSKTWPLVGFGLPVMWSTGLPVRCRRSHMSRFRHQKS